uniref:GRAM domain-containing protein n=1 Tax=Chromera velia CCMP2878 TaxID=1169474 RepID=A0A0G4GDC9_9ALVE|mmetsp:Transcript_44387/g.87717  ORF Transcript_44387/g.87717 Transcript_44387/m.87717 type:complete len:257 (+) Transcript_44387:151-921(+)|eukprot:Cvel_21363.t1-p1 / transcript=Cvel_21363.t1 / gene=Cvel_21363 / organism=Chromera_velia_CCMP2878 / gene_product=UPF0664 stress-induced protein C29B12.11c, putative / transcript_product=UPF0664 stress-induced protein C29B12.11c, putative / location=Cvel_scaffold1997:2732-7477(+) / protein_length=256 / sequence_SO=supercontig / SO=protein_coding / is_pseudo=false
MAINPHLAQEAYSRRLYPLAVPGELFILERDGIKFQAKTPTGKLHGNGSMFLTTKRIVFLKKGDPSRHGDFTSFEIPLAFIRDPAFKQPIFGANYMQGQVAPLLSAPNPISGDATWYLTFNQGGCGTFLPLFFRLHKEAVRDLQPSPQFFHQVQSGQLQQVAFVDPADPSVLFITQPQPLDPPPGYHGNQGQQPAQAQQQPGQPGQQPQPGAPPPPVDASAPPPAYDARGLPPPGGNSSQRPDGTRGPSTFMRGIM